MLFDALQKLAFLAAEQVKQRRLSAFIKNAGFAGNLKAKETVYGAGLWACSIFVWLLDSAAFEKAAHRCLHKMAGKKLF